MKLKQDANTDRIRHWLINSPGTNQKRLGAFLKKQGAPSPAITHLLHAGSLKKVRAQVVAEFQIKSEQ